MTNIAIAAVAKDAHESHDSSNSSKATQEEDPVDIAEMKRLLLWGDIIAHFGEVVQQNPRGLADLIRRGVPDGFRGWRGRSLLRCATPLCRSSR